jgi:acetyltransferase-like isoleucine patch superfamily enzyme
MKKLIFLGTNSVLERYIEACEQQGQEIEGVIDSDWYGNRDSFAGLPLLDSEKIFQEDLKKYSNNVFFIGVNWNPTYQRDQIKRKMFIDIVKHYNLPCINLISPNSYVSKYSTLGSGIFIGSNCSIEPRANIGSFVSIYENSTVGHDNYIGENSVLQRNTLVHAKIGKNSYVGISSIIMTDGSTIIGDNVVISPCLHVARNVNDNEHVTIDKKSLRIYRNKNQASD